MEILIPTPRDFSFKRTAISHGWSELPPFDIDRQAWVLTRVVSLADGRAITVTLTQAKRGVKVGIPRKTGKRALEKVERDVRHMLRLDDDLSEFYTLVSADDDFAWVACQGAGRLLRAPTVFEDLVKMICTTNCSWSLTDKMVRSLVEALGEKSNDHRRAFPTAESMAEQPERFYRDVVRAGYRAPYLKELADRVASGEIEVESWLTSEKTARELKREMKQVKGVGDYAAENLLKLVGRYDGLALDSWVRSRFAAIRNSGRPAADKKIELYYSRFGPWRGLAVWCDVTRDWNKE
jgi:N-glycosylase/DNA lyase